MSLIHAIAGSVANAAGGFSLGGEMWEQLDHATPADDTTDVTFTSAGSASAWSGYRDLFFYIAAKSEQSTGETPICFELNGYDLATSSNRQYYNYRFNNGVKGSSFTNFEYSNIPAGTGSQYSQNFAWAAGVYSDFSGVHCNTLFTLFDINNNKTKYMRVSGYTPGLDTSTSAQNVHDYEGIWTWYGTGGKNSSVPAITQVNFFCKESGHEWGDGTVISLFGIKDA